VLVRPPVVRYAKSDDGVHVAFQVFGDGPGLLYVPHWATHLEVLWEEPLIADFLRRLGTFSTVVLFDKRGTGLSDPISAPVLPTLERWCDDALTVLNAAGIEEVALLGVDAGGLLMQLFAALHPSRTRSLVLYGSAARLRRADDYPAGIPDWLVTEYLDTVEQHWGSEILGLDISAPSMVGDEAYREWVARYQRQSASPGVILAMMRMIVEVDLRSILATIRAPTLVLHRTDDRWYPIGHGRYLAEHIPNARFVELSGADHNIEAGDSDAVVRQIEDFLTGTAPAPNLDGVLATLLFTDLVSSTEELSQRGDQSWRGVLDRHDALVGRQLQRYRGRLVKLTGDGLLATFDGPARAVRCAGAIRETVRSLGLQVRAGLHAGEVTFRDDDVSGLAVHIAERVCSSAPADEILVTRTIVDLISGSGLRFEPAGDHTLKGVPGVWQLFRARP
jgi:pimeloyl-ACP methyl ester carboxylesterase